MGTDAVVDGWMQLSRQLGAQRPYTDTWRRLDEEAASGVAPAGAESVAHCGGCDAVTRRRDDGAVCTRCHPVMQF
ncbi:hypothetical protein ACFYPN_15975 [Streptomyces sp. NPDC005576]|uniref:hypothetical protein n=1 Tax=Streptomyces sp. NPDC005576 TaxID=3364726 RepID=UPI0036BE85D1